MLLTTEPVVQFTSASPLWESQSSSPAAMQRPALLRFASDTFMDDLARILNSPTPAALSAHVAAPVSFRARPVGADPGWTPPALALKLYQPLHGHFNLVACSLVCRLAGLPDRFVDSASGERAAFILRRLDATGAELAWADDPALGLRRWQPVPADDPIGGPVLAPGEELHPLFPLNFDEEGRRRRLLAGLIPTESRESFPPDAAASALVPTPAELAAEGDPRLEDLYTRAIGPLESLILQKTADAGLVPAEQDATRFLMLDLGEWLATHLPAFWAAVLAGTPPTTGGAPATQLYSTLGAPIDPFDANSPSWRAALRESWAKRAVIADDAPGTPNALPSVRKTLLAPATLQAQCAALLPALPAGPASPIPPAQLPPKLRWLPKFDGSPATRYVLRCVYLRPACEPLIDPVLSPPTEPFAIAPAFDPDAPARAIRIALPVDTSIKGLRQHNKSVGILISNQLRQQMNAVTDLKKALDGDLAAGEPFDLGVICSFSIPIITICALIVLIIFLYLLNIVFWWLPFFRLCLPVKASN